MPPVINSIADTNLEFESIQSFKINAEDENGGSGILGYEVYGSENGGEYRLVSDIINIEDKFTFEAEPNTSYCLAPVVIDNVNNKSAIDTENAICFTTPSENDVTTQYYSLTLEKSGNGIIETFPKTSYFENATNVNIEAVADEGWTFDRWENDLSSSINSETILMDSDKTVKAIFVEEAYILTINTEGNGSLIINPESSTYTYGTNISISANPDTCWFFDRWKGDLESFDNSEVISMNGNKTVTAVFLTGLKLRTQVNNATCSESFDGNIELEVLGGTPPYTYDWDNDNTGSEDLETDSKNLINIENGTYTVLVTDFNGLTVSTTASIGIEDSISPSIKSIGDQIETLNTECKIIIKDYSVLVNISDNCVGALEIKQYPAVGTEITIKTNVILTATDASNNKSSIAFNIIPKDNTPPVMTPIANQTINRNEICTVYLPNYSSLVQVTDNCSNTIKISQIPASSTVISENTQITISATDVQGNKSSTSFMVALEGEPVIYYFDYDGDGFGVDNELTNKTLCQLPNNNYSTVAGDCDDNHASLNPGTNEDCDGSLSLDANHVFRFKLYPNPVKEKLTLNFFNTATGSTIITIFDALGRKISTTQVVNQTIVTLELNDKYQEGLYLIKVINNNKITTKRFIIKR